MKTLHAAALFALITLMPAPTAAQTMSSEQWLSQRLEQYMEEGRRKVDRMHSDMEASSRRAIEDERLRDLESRLEAIEQRQLCRVGTGARTRPCF